MVVKQAGDNIFSDRRCGYDRRDQSLPMPMSLDRRRRCRRSRSFTTQPWWLRTSYAAELISESTKIETAPYRGRTPQNPDRDKPTRPR